MNAIERKKFNISLLGETWVGKTSMVEVLSNNTFSETRIATIGLDCITQTAVFDNKNYIFKIFDTAGQEKYNSISASTLKIADGFLLVFSVDKKETLNKIANWIDNIESLANRKEKVLILVGNKIDINEREVSSEEGKIFAQERGMKYFETSAKNKFNIKEVFNEMYKDIYELNKNLENQNKNANDDNKNNKMNTSFGLDKKNNNRKNDGRCC